MMPWDLLGYPLYLTATPCYLMDHERIVTWADAGAQLRWRTWGRVRNSLSSSYL
jgi:hypothetical protein